MTLYEELTTPAEMSADCEATRRRMAKVARRAVAPAPSILFEDFPREVPKRDIEITDAAKALAGAVHFHLD